MTMNVRRARYYMMLGLMIAAMITVIGGLSAYRAYVQSYETFKRQAHQMVRVQSDSLAKPVWDFDRDDVGKLLATFKSDPDFQYARVMGERGQVMAESGRPVDDERDVLEIEEPILFKEMRGEQPIGTLLVQYETGQVKFHWLIMMVEQAVTLFILVGAIVFLLVRALKNPAPAAQGPGLLYKDEHTDVRRMVRDVRAMVLDIYDSNAVGEVMEAKLTRLEEALSRLEKKVRHAQA